MRRPFALPTFVFALAIAGLPAVAAAQQQTLTIGKTVSGQVSSSAPAVYQFRASSAGVLAIALLGDSDLALNVTDEEGQTLPDASSDRDMYGSTGTEQLLVNIGEAGTYRVNVRLVDGGSSKFELGAGWIPMPAMARPADPDRRASMARAIETGKSHEDSLGAGSGDFWDWFALSTPTPGTLTVILRPLADSTVDLVLELYADGDLSKPLVRSDNDLQGNSANESATVDVKPGQKIFAKVSGASSNPDGKYRIASSLIQ